MLLVGVFNPGHVLQEFLSENHDNDYYFGLMFDIVYKNL